MLSLHLLIHEYFQSSFSIPAKHMVTCAQKMGGNVRGSLGLLHLYTVVYSTSEIEIYNTPFFLQSKSQ